MITAARIFDDSRAHYYTQDGTPAHSVPCKSKPGTQRPTTIADARKLKLLPSPTTILKILHRPALEAWKIEQAVLAVLSSPLKPDETIDAFVERILQTDREQDQERDAAAKRGTDIHRAIQLALEGNEWDQGLAPHVTAATDLVTFYGAPMASEKRVVGDGYAGTLDCLAVNPEEITIIDFKTCKKIPAKPYPEHELQASAYAGALGNTGDKRIRAAIIYVTSIGAVESVAFSVDWEAKFKAFRKLLEFWYLQNNYPQ